MDPQHRKLKSILQHKPSGPPASALGIVGFLCAAATLLLEDTLARTSLLACGLSLMLLGLIYARRAQSHAVQTRVARRKKLILQDAVSALVTHDPDPALLANLDGEIQYANPAAKAVFGNAADKDLSTAFSQILANPDNVLFRLQNRVLTVGAAKEDVVTRTGQYRFSVVRADEEMQLWRFEQIGEASRDVSRSSDTHSLPMMTIGPSNAVLYVNEAMRKMSGIRPKSVSDIFVAPPQRSGELHRNPTVNGEIDVIVAVVQGVAGRREIYVLPNEDDVSEKSTEIAEEWDAIEDLPVPLMKISPLGQILSSNREARQLFAVEDTTNKMLDDLLDGLGRPLDHWISEALQGQVANVSQFLRGRGSRSDTFVQVMLNRAQGEQGPHLIAVINDVTELKTLEAQFVQSQKMQAIGQLAGGVAHDFNNLLTAISGHCDLLLLRHDAGDQNYGDLIQIHQNANRAASLVGQLLAFSRKQNLQPERIELPDVLAELTHLLNRLVGERVRLLLEHEPDLAPVKADKRQLEQVVMNLVVNARDAMPEGGEIRIKTENVNLDEDLRKGRAVVHAGQYVLLRVEDEGTGIPPESMQKIFEPFYTTKRTNEGTGLGLSTVYGIVKQTGGFIFAESELGVGTEFQIYLPAHTIPIAESLPIPVEQLPEAPLTGDAVVLLVEDEAPVRAFASRALRLRGYTVLEADCAEMALELLKDDDLDIDIFVTDVIMPGMDGPTWVKEALVDRPGTKVVFVSGYAEDAFKGGKSDVPNSVFLPKPFSLAQLTATVGGQLI